MQDRRLKLADGKLAAIPNDWNDDQIAEFITTYDGQSRESQFNEVAGNVRRTILGDRDNRASSIPDVLAQAASMTPIGRGAMVAKNAPRIVTNLMQRFPRIANAAIRTGTAATAGVVGSVARSMLDDTPESARDVAENALMEMGKQGGIQLGGAILEDGGKAVAGGMMRRALGPGKSAMSKYGDLPRQALDDMVVVSPGGLEKVVGRREAAQAAKVDAINTARPVSLLTDPMRRGAINETLPDAVGQRLAGMRPTMDPTRAVTEFGGGRHGLTLAESELAKRSLDKSTDAARAARRMGRAPKLSDAEQIALTKEILKSQDAVAPQLRPLNATIRRNMGLEQAVRGRLQQPATGIADDLTGFAALSDPRALAVRALRGPTALSRSAIALDQLRKGAKVTPALVRALMMTSRDQ